MVRASTPHPTAANYTTAGKRAPVRPDVVRKLREFELPISPQEYCDAEKAGVIAACQWYFRLQAKPIAVAEADIQQSARMGVWDAALRYQPERGLKFITLALSYAVGRAKHFIRDEGGVFAAPRRLRERIPVLSRARQRLTLQLGREPTAEELAVALECSSAEVVDCLTYLDLQFPESLDIPVGEYDRVIRSEIVPDDAPDFREGFLSAAAVESALGLLDVRLRAIIEHRFFHELSQLETGRRLGLSQMHVSRLERRALEQLRHVWPQ